MKKNKDIIDELNDIAPLLGSLNPTTKEDIKKDYFDNLQNRIISELEQQNLAENGTLKSYFEELPNTVHSKASTSRPSIVKYISGIAAILVIVVASVFFLNQNLSDQRMNEENTFVESLEDQDLIYLVDYLGYETEFATLIIDDTESQDLNEDITDDMLEYLDESTLIEALEF